ncbi:uncharacterized protein N7482_000761 [Penicillium canariense]|uniref:HNH nuclease domain-containing protein n=1 Tax=Penicillium canariense TaxID=189055 RepID=A0A9W9IES0_9EURO|nr:uncharacterized protein N7482_000761 [Penicillium canariense]KAJ5174884.1 hypothetical protein N7482_000761 [Penicillium canariense]
MLREDRQTLVSPGNYIVRDHEDQTPITVQLTTKKAPRRVTTKDQSSGSLGQTTLFRRTIRARDTICAISKGSAMVTKSDKPYRGLTASHIFPTSQLEEWNRHNYRLYITDPSPATEIGQSGLYSPQNGLLLSTTVHEDFDAFLVGVDPDADYKIIIFGGDPTGLGGARLKDSARNGTNPNNRVSAELLRWHLRMCVYSNMKANADPGPEWEEDLGSDDMGQILEQPDAGERMEVELFTRLGPRVA